MRSQRERILMRHLPGRERTALEMRDNGSTYRQIGQELNVTQERAKQIHTQAAKRLQAVAVGQPDSPEGFYFQERFREVMQGVPPRPTPGVYLGPGGFQKYETPTITRHVLASHPPIPSDA